MKRLWKWLFPAPIDLMAAQMAEVAGRPDLPKEGGFEWSRINADTITSAKISTGSIAAERLRVPVTYFQPEPPPPGVPKIGDMWFRTGRDNAGHRFDGSRWVLIANG